MKASIIIRYLFVLSCLILFLKSSFAFFFWDYNINYLYLANIFFGYLYLMFAKYKIHIKLYFFLSIIFLLISIIWPYSEFRLSLWLAPISIFSLFLISDQDRLYLLKFITTIISKFLIVSLILFLISQFVPLPNYGSITYLDVNANYEYTNYLLFLKSNIDSIRFNSIFLEPGHLSMICSFLIFANNYNYKDKNVIILSIVLFFTFALAGYILFVLGYIFINISKYGFRYFFSHKPIKLMTVILVLLGSAQLYNSGDNYINNLILSRLSFDSEKGISGNNRFSEGTDEYFSFIIGTDEFWKGLGHDQIEQINKYNKDNHSYGRIAGAGYKIFILERGMITLLLVFAFYFSIAFFSNNRHFMYAFLLLLSFAFIQRAYPYWYSWIFVYLCCAEYKTKKKYII